MGRHLQAGISGSTSLIWNLWVLISKLRRHRPGSMGPHLPAGLGWNLRSPPQTEISGSKPLSWNLWVLISELGWDLWVFISRLSGMGSDPRPAPASKSGHGSPHLPAGTYGPPSPNRDLWVSIAQRGWMGITGLSFAPSSVPHRQRMGGGSRGSDAGTRPAGSSRPWRNSSSSTAARQQQHSSAAQPLPHRSPFPIPSPSAAAPRGAVCGRPRTRRHTASTAGDGSAALSSAHLRDDGVEAALSPRVIAGVGVQHPAPVDAA